VVYKDKAYWEFEMMKWKRLLKERKLALEKYMSGEEHTYAISVYNLPGEYPRSDKYWKEWSRLNRLVEIANKKYRVSNSKFTRYDIDIYIKNSKEREDVLMDKILRDKNGQKTMF